MTVKPSIEYCEILMATVDEMEARLGFDATLLTMLHVTSAYMHMYCEKKDFRSAVKQASEIMLENMRNSEKFVRENPDEQIPWGLQ